MKKLDSFVIIVFILSACSLNSESKAKNLINERLKSTLNDFSKYEPIEFSTLDTLFSFYWFDSEYEKLSGKYSRNIENLDFARETKDKADDFNRRVGRIIDKRGIAFEPYIKEKEAENDSLRIIMKTFRLNYKPTMVGYKMTHKFRAANAFGGKIIVEWLFYFDKDLLKITDVLDDERLQQFEKIKQLEKLEDML
jgi:hypothetical protein